MVRCGDAGGCGTGAAASSFACAAGSSSVGKSLRIRSSEIFSTGGSAGGGTGGSDFFSSLPPNGTGFGTEGAIAAIDGGISGTCTLLNGAFTMAGWVAEAGGPTAGRTGGGSDLATGGAGVGAGSFDFFSSISPTATDFGAENAAAATDWAFSVTCNLLNGAGTMACLVAEAGSATTGRTGAGSGLATGISSLIASRTAAIETNGIAVGGGSEAGVSAGTIFVSVAGTEGNCGPALPVSPAGLGAGLSGSAGLVTAAIKAG